MNLHNRQNAHHDIDHIFKDLLPVHSMPERPEQIVLSHRMLDAMLDSEIALCEMQITNSLQAVEDFIHNVKGPDYFQEDGR